MRGSVQEECDVVSAVLGSELLPVNSLSNRRLVLKKSCGLIVFYSLVIILSWPDADNFVQKRRRYVVGDFNL